MTMLARARYEERLRDIRLLATDVDGVLTDGSIIYTGHGEADPSAETKIFNVRDGSAFHIARLLGVPVLVITARESAAVRRRFEELPVCGFRQGVFDKVSACRQVQRQLGIQMQQVAYPGTISSTCRCCAVSVWRLRSPMRIPGCVPRCTG